MSFIVQRQYDTCCVMIYFLQVYLSNSQGVDCQILYCDRIAFWKNQTDNFQYLANNKLTHNLAILTAATIKDLKVPSPTRFNKENKKKTSQEL